MFGRKKTREVEPVRRLFQNDALEVSVLSVIIALPADAMTPFLSLGGDGRGQVQIVTASRNVRELEADVARVKPRIVVLHTKTSGYSPDVVRRIVDSAHGRVAVIVIGRAGGEWEVEAREAGAVAVYPEPVDEATVDRFVEEAPGLVDEIELRRGQLHADAALVWAPGTNPTQAEDFRAGTSVSFSLGPQFQLWGKGLKGLFLGPKVYGIYSDNNALRGRSLFSSGPRLRWRTGEAGVGVDLAFQWHFGRFFLGSVVGASVGYALTPTPANIDIWSTFGGAN